MNTFPPGERAEHELSAGSAIDALTQAYERLKAFEPPAFRWNVRVTDVSVEKLDRGVLVIFKLVKKKGDPWPDELRMTMPTSRADVIECSIRQLRERQTRKKRR